VRRRPAPLDGPVVLGTLARLDPIKGLDLLLDAAASLPQARVLVVGEGPLREELEAQAQRLGLADRVELRGWVDDAPACLGEMDLFVLPSRNEGFPLSIVEAMLVGLPVVAADVGSVTEAVRDGETGLVVPPDDLPALRRALEGLVTDAAERARLGDAGRQVASDRFTASVMAASFVELYEELLAG
jgi:glycosyltransferase involved in cell wall biosynthesis